MEDIKHLKSICDVRGNWSGRRHLQAVEEAGVQRNPESRPLIKGT